MRNDKAKRRNKKMAEKETRVLLVGNGEIELGELRKIDEQALIIRTPP